MSRPDRLRQLIVVGVLVILALAALRDLSRLGAGLPWRTMDEFADFYCAGSALNHRASPYTYEPLRTCEHLVNSGTNFRGKLFASNPGIAVPAPQPPYDFVAFMALARLPIATARRIDAFAIVASVVLCAIALAGMGVPLDVAAAALLLSTGFVELNTAQIVPFALLALVLGGLALARRREALAGVLAALTAIEPTVGVPVIVATLLFVPRARIAVTVTTLLLILAAVAVVGARGAVEYLTVVLPAHAGSEIRFPFQYSLTYALASAGLAPAVARFAGTLSYFILFAIGLMLAPRLQRALGRRELLIFIPALCAVIAGAFLHQEELCFALPAILVLAVATQGPIRSFFAIAVCVLSIPWLLVWGEKQLLLAAIFVCAVILLRLRIDLRVALVTLCALAATMYLFELAPPHLPIPAQIERVYAPHELAQREWRNYTDQRSTRDFLWLAIKIPTWLALLAALAIAARLARGPSQSAIAEGRLEVSTSRRI
jgi:hypothetical protein